MTEADKIPVEVAYALPEKQEIVMLEVQPGTTAREAVLQSGLERHFPGLALNGAKLLFQQARTPLQSIWLFYFLSFSVSVFAFVLGFRNNQAN